MKKILRQILLSLLCLYTLFFISCATLPPILSKLKLYDISSKLHFMLMNSCHQKPTRSFWLFGYPMSLCCRCYGFYIGVFISLILVLINKFNINKKVFFCLFTLIIIDLFLNFILGFNTGNTIRFIIGIFMGITFTYILNVISNLLFKGEKNV